jgi:hypothetical protein
MLDAWDKSSCLAGDTLVLKQLVDQSYLRFVRIRAIVFLRKKMLRLSNLLRVLWRTGS